MIAESELLCYVVFDAVPGQTRPSSPTQAREVCPAPSSSVCDLGGTSVVRSELTEVFSTRVGLSDGQWPDGCTRLRL